MTDIAQDKTDKQLHKERKDYIIREYGELLNKTVLEIRPLRRHECEALGWDYGSERDAFVIMLSGNLAVIPMCDPEGNGTGHLMVADWA